MNKDNLVRKLTYIQKLYRQWSVYPYAESEMTALINALTKELDSVKVDSVSVNVINAVSNRSDYE